MDRNAAAAPAKSPYSVAPDRSFWSRGVSRGFAAADLLPPGIIVFRRGDRVMSAGSCFAAHMVPYLEKSGFTYVRAEVRNPLLRVPGEKFGYDNFSAAYGNIYTARQLLQLLHRSVGLWEPQERVWRDGEEFVDPFRPGLCYRARSAREFDLLTRQHLAAVRRALTDATVFVFTLGLTEAWLSRADGAVFPACPGTIAGRFDPNQHTFHNLSAAEVTADLNEFIREARKLNPALRIVFTISPVPLVATGTGGHALTATIYSKSVLRVAADEVARANPDVIYFPAYEIVTGPQASYDFFEADRRNVAKHAIDTVMQALLAHCEGAPGQDKVESAAKAALPQPAAMQSLAQQITQAECDEMMSDPQGADD